MTTQMCSEIHQIFDLYSIYSITFKRYTDSQVTVVICVSHACYKCCGMLIFEML